MHCKVYLKFIKHDDVSQSNLALWPLRRMRLGLQTGLLRRGLHSSPDTVVPVSLAPNWSQPHRGLQRLLQVASLQQVDFEAKAESLWLFLCDVFG